MPMDKEDVIAITEYLTKRIYPEGLSKGDKRSMRKKAQSFCCNDGVLYHRGKEGKQQLVVYDHAERQRIISTMHNESANRNVHNGISATIRKVSDWYWWRRMAEDVRIFCKNCSECVHLFGTGGSGFSSQQKAEDRYDVNIAFSYLTSFFFMLRSSPVLLIVNHESYFLFPREKDKCPTSLSFKILHRTKR